MSSRNSYPVLINNLKELLEAVNREPEVQPSIEEERQTLAQALAEVQSLRARQAELTALRQEATQQIKAALAQAKDAAIQVRSVVRGKIGPRNERLVHFKVTPIRKRRRKPVEKEAGEEASVDQRAAAIAFVKPAA
jgi:hypothetical protein